MTEKINTGSVKMVVRCAEFQTRETDGNLYIEGYFAVFGSRYELWEGAAEMVDPNAFDLERDKDVRALTNHDTTLVLGRTTVGTLTLRVDERGLWGSILVNESDQDAMNLYARVRRGDVSECSFGFDILDQEMQRQSDGFVLWIILGVKLWEVSVCTFAAYQDTHVEARAAELAAVQKSQIDRRRAEILQKLKGE